MFLWLVSVPDTGSHRLQAQMRAARASHCLRATSFGLRAAKHGLWAATLGLWADAFGLCLKIPMA